MRKLLLIPSLLLLLAACGPSEQDMAIEKVYNELMEGHDAVMPKSMLLPKMKTKVIASVADLAETDSLKAAALDLSQDLNMANEAMYTWMEEFAVAMNDVEDKGEKLKLYEALNIEIAEIATATNEAMEQAKVFIEENE